MIYSKEYIKQQFPYATFIEVTNGSHLFTIDNEDEFVSFMSLIKPSIIFISEHFINIKGCKIDTSFEERYAINPALFEDKDYLKFILPMCEAHNEAVQNSVLSNIPIGISVFVLHEGVSIRFTYRNNINPQNIILSPRDALLNIMNSTETEYAQIKAVKRREELAKIKDQEIMLGQLILSDERFLRCTSQPKRKQYIRQLIQSELGDEYALLKNHWIMPNRGLRSDVDWFIEDLWAQREKITNKTE